MRNAAIINVIETLAPASLQEKWDNTGLQLGSPQNECTGVMICFDVTPDVVDEAIASGCNLIIAHHPLFFSPVKSLTAATLSGQVALKAIAAGISIYCSHTAADSTVGGVSYALASILGIDTIRTLSPAADQLVRLTVTVPLDRAEEVRAALFDGGAGAIGCYDGCSFNTEGYGTFRALEGADPYAGTVGEDHIENETQISVVLMRRDMARVESLLLEVHPYEEPAYQFTPMLNRMRRYGLGVYGTLPQPLTPTQLISRIKERLGTPMLRTTVLPDDPDLKISRIALCGGAGHDLIGNALAAGAQAYITADLKYHDFVEYRGRILLIDAGHFETEAPIKQVFADAIRKTFPDIRVMLTSTADNPVRYC